MDEINEITLKNNKLLPIKILQNNLASKQIRDYECKK